MKKILSNIEAYSVHDFTISIVLVVFSCAALYLFLKFVKFFTSERIMKGGGMFFTHNGKPLELPSKKIRHMLNEELKSLYR